MRDIDPAVYDGWQLTDPEAWGDLRETMHAACGPLVAEDYEPMVTPVRGYPCPAWSDGTSTWIAARDAIHVKGVESVSYVDDWHVDVLFSSGDTARMLTSDKLYVSEVG